MMSKAQKFIEGLKTIHRPAVWAAQIGVFALSGVAAFLLRFDFGLPPGHMRHLAYALPIWIVVKIVVFRVAKLDRGWWRYVSVTDLLRVCTRELRRFDPELRRDPLHCAAGIPPIHLPARSDDLLSGHGRGSDDRSHDGGSHCERAERRRGEEHADLRRGRGGSHSTQGDSEESQTAVPGAGIPGRLGRTRRACVSSECRCSEEAIR